MRELQSDEPIVRYKALLHLLTHNKLTDKNINSCLFHVISLLEDSNIKIRFAAGNVLTKYSRRLDESGQKMAIAVIIKSTIDAFSSIESKEDFKKFTTNTLAETRIQALYNLKGFIQIMDSNHKIFNYLNFLISTILESSVLYLIVAAIKLITDLPKTLRNSKRVFGIFYPRIQMLDNDNITLKSCIEKFYSSWDYLRFFRDSSKVSSVEEFQGVINDYKWFGKKLNVPIVDKIWDLQGFSLDDNSNLPTIGKGILRFGREKDLVFMNFPFQEIVYINNTSNDMDLDFSLQVFPTEFFTVSPAFGTIKKGESMGINLKFTPNPSSSHILQMIHGFIRIRSQGVALERLELIAFNLPYLKVTPDVIDFDIVQNFESKTAYISLENFLPVDLNVVTIIRKMTKDSPFGVENSQIALPASARTNIPITFYPRTGKGVIKDQLLICALGVIYKVDLVGCVGETLTIKNFKLDFGFTDIYSGQTLKKIYMKNQSKKSLPITYLASSNEIILNQGKPIILEPLEELAVSVEFKPNFTGDRKENIQIFAPYSSILTVDVRTFVGQTLLIPILEDIFFPIVMVDGMASAQFPVTNVYSTSVQFNLLLPLYSPFKIVSIEWERYNRKLSSGAILADIRNLEVGGKSGFQVTLGSSVTAVVEVSFTPSLSRLVRTPLEISSLKPNKSYSRTLYLNGISLDASFFRQEGISLAQIRRFSRGPFRESITSSFSKSQSLEMKRLRDSSKVFQLDPPCQIIFGSFLERKLRTDIYEYVTLTNLTNRSQKFQLIVSQHFVIDIPLEGELPSLSSLQIPIRLNRYFFTNGIGITMETASYTGAGSLTVIDSNPSNPGTASVNLYGIMNDLVDVELRSDLEKIRFPNSSPSQTSIRSIHVRNCIHMDVVLEAGIGSIEEKTMQRRSDGSPFRLTSNRVVLKPYEYLMIDVSFMSTIAGLYQGKLFMEYRDFIQHGGIFDKQIIEPSRNLINVALECLVGNYLIDSDSTFVDFGRVTVDSIIQKQISFTNMSNESSNLLSNLSNSFTYSLDNWKLRQNSKSILNVSFEATSKPFCYDFLLTVYPFSFSSVFCRGWSGRVSLSTNMGDFKKLESDDTYILNVDRLNIGYKQNEIVPLSLQNTGSYDILIYEINLEGAPLVTEYRFKDSAFSRFYQPTIGNQNEDISRFDWDEFEYLNDAKTCNSLSPMSLKKRSGSKDTFSRGKSNDFLNTQSDTKPQSNPYFFPILLRSGDSIYLDLYITPNVEGAIINSIHFMAGVFGQKRETYLMSFPMMIQPILSVEPDILDFGICSSHRTYTCSAKFTNRGTIPMHWSTEFMGSKMNHIAITGKHDDLKYSAPFEVFPTDGLLSPDHTQKLQIKFVPVYKNHEVISQLNLRTAKFGFSKLIIKGIGACSNVAISNESLDFGALRVGTKKLMKVQLKNSGILPGRFYVESSSANFSVEPEVFVLDGMSEVTISVSFCPKEVGIIKTNLLLISSNPHENESLIVSVKGIGSYPDISVLTRKVDFGIALFMTKNIQPIEIENKGATEAEITYHCNHTGIQLESADDLAVVNPMSTKIFNLVYTPHAVETLNSKIFIKSSDSRGFEFAVSLKGLVGIPKLVFEPADVINGLNFDTTFIYKTAQRQFIIRNEGNIVLQFNIVAEKVRETILMGNSHDHTSLIPDNVFSIEPASGSLQVGQSKVVVVKFTPTSVTEFEYDLLISYDYQSKRVPMTGCGGQSILQMDDYFRYLDFGVCRISRVFQKTLKLKNVGNIGFRFLVRPEPCSKNWNEYSGEIEAFKTCDLSDVHSIEPSNLEWKKGLSDRGFKLTNHQGVCPPHGCTDVIVSFSPLAESVYGVCLRIFYEDKHIDVNVQGQGASPKLSLYDPLTRQFVRGDGKSIIDIGVHPVESSYGHIIQLINEGAFGLDFYVQPMTLAEFDVGPVRGYIEPRDSIPLTIKFRASGESKFHSPLKIFWEKESIKATVVGKGGLGKMQLLFNSPDSVEKGFNFGNLPLSSSNRKKFSINNIGMVGMTVLIDLVHDEFSIAQASDPLSIPQVDNLLNSSLFPNSDLIKWGSAIRLMLEPNRGIIIVVKFSAKSITLASANLIVKTEFDRISMPVLGHGGTISLSHKGDLNFGEIACNYIFSRKICLANSGSISANISAKFSIAGHACNDDDPSHVKLSEVYTGLDPRSGWARQQLCREKNMDSAKSKLSSREYWKLIAYMILKHLVKDDVIGESSKAKFLSGKRSSVLGLTTNSHARISASGLKKFSNVSASTHFKRKQMFYHLITNNQLTSQSVCRVKPFIKADPGNALLPSYGEITYNVEVCVANETQIIGTLTFTSDIPNTPVYEIPFSLQPKSVNIICDDTRVLNFYRQPLGSSEIIIRTFSNVGKKDVSFKFSNPNSSLTINPQKGSLKIGQTISVSFTFKPVDEGIQNADVIFEPDFSQPIKLKMYGGGGQAIASLSRYKRFDFGHCMIGKETISHLPIFNEGNAVLHLVRFELIETATFFKGPDWPSERISLFPGKSFNLPIVFSPSEESVSPGRLLVGTNSESFEIELTGSGREAVLIVSKVALEFSECLIGNSYEQKLGLKNIGDVNYPVSFKLEKEFPDVQFVPSSMLITPFTENFVIVSYTPSRETKTTVVLTIHSPYSTHKVPLLLHAGTAILEFESNILDFGLFEKSTKPVLNLAFKNTGTVRTSYLVKDPNKPSLFFIAQPRGQILPGKSVAVPIMHVRHEIEEFEHKIVVKTDLINKLYNIKARGQCEETVVHYDEFSLLNLGTCPVLESSSKPLTFKNYGRFPLSYNIKANYPLKVVPASGKVEGDATETVSVTWSPSGAYELRGQIVMETNIGNFNINIRGRAIFPDLSVDNMYIDFGICAVDHIYQRKIVLANHGKVLSKFSIPESKDPSFWVSQKGGVLKPKETADIIIYFKPTALQRFMSSILVECKGIHYKEIATIGVGGIHKLEILPSSIDLGRFPFNLQSYVPLSLKNSGDVSIHAEFYTDDNSSDPNCAFLLPEPLSVGPGRTVKCSVGIQSQSAGPLSSKLRIKTLEGTYIVPLKGLVVQINLTERNREILNSEKIATTQVLDIGRIYNNVEELDLIIKRQSKSFLDDMELVTLFGKLYSKLGHSAFTRNFCVKDYQIPENLKDHLANLDNPTPSTINSLFDGFIRRKHATHHDSKIEEDLHIKEILEYGHIDIRHISYDAITALTEPNLEVDLSIILNRPPPFFGPEKKIIKEKKNAIFTHSLPLLRKARNAKTVDFFKKS